MAINVKVNKTNIEILSKDIVNQGEYNLNKCIFEFDEVYNGLTKRAIFTNTFDEKYLVEIVDNECTIPQGVLKLMGNVMLGVYAYEDLNLRYSPTPVDFDVVLGSYVKDVLNVFPNTPVKDLIDEYNENAVNKTNEFNQNYADKINEYNQNHTEKLNTFNNNFNDKTSDFNQNYTDKLNKYNQNHAEKLQQFDENYTTKFNTFNNNVVNKTNEFNNNAEIKTDEFNDNVYTKVEEFDINAENIKKELQAISNTARDFVSAVTFTTIEQNFETGNLEVNNQDSLGNMGFQFNYETGNLEVHING